MLVIDTSRIVERDFTLTNSDRARLTKFQNSLPFDHLRVVVSPVPKGYRTTIMGRDGGLAESIGRTVRESIKKTWDQFVKSINSEFLNGLTSVPENIMFNTIKEDLIP